MFEQVYEPRRASSLTTSIVSLPAVVSAEWTRVVESRFVIRQMVASSLRVRYQRSVLGVAWTLLHPLLMLSVLSLVFSELFRVGVERFPVYLFAGMLPWQFFAQSIGEGSRSLIEREGLVRRMPVPLIVFPIVSTCVAATHGTIAMAALSLLLPFFSFTPSVHLVMIPAAALLLAMFSLGLVLITMTLVTYYRDVEHFVAVALQAGYFATPILYLPSLVPDLGWLLSANPMRWILSLFQHAIYFQTWPPSHAWLAAGGSSLCVLLAGLLIYKRCEHSYVFRL